MRRKLCEKGSDEIAPVLFVYVPKIEVEISHGGLTGIPHNFHFLDDRGTGGMTNISHFERKRTRITNQRMVLPEPAAKKKVVRWSQAGVEEGRTFSVDPKKRLGTC